MKFAQLALKALLLVLTTVFLVATCLAQDVAPASPVVTVLQGKVVDARTGAAVVDAFVEWKHGDRTQNTWTDAYGAYAFAIPVQDQDHDDARADQGEFVVSIRANLYLGAKANVQVRSGKPTIRNFALTPKRADQVGVLSGRVTNAKSGQDMGGVSISILNAGGLLSTLTNSDGTYTISGVGYSDGLVLEVKPGPILPPSGTEDESTKSSPCFAPIERSFEMVTAALEKNFTLNVLSIPNLPPNVPCPGPRLSPPPPPPTGAPGTGQLPDDSSIQWQQADISEIVLNSDLNLWHAGHVNDILKLNGGAGLLVGADSGGVWLIPPKGQATPLSNTWGSVNIDALAFGADGPTNIYAGTFQYPGLLNWVNPAPASPGGVLFETDTSTPDPLKNWLPVHNITYLANEINSSPPCGSIYRILVINEVRRIVLACDNGVWWSPIPAPPPPSVRIYNWKRAIPDAALSALEALDNPPFTDLLGGFSGLAKGPGWSTGAPGTPPGEGTIIASNNPGITPEQLIFYGGWSSNGDLVLHSANVPNPAAHTLGFQDFGRTSVASCVIDPTLMFAIAADPDDSGDDIRGTWKSEDGGQNWTVVSSPPDPGNQGSYNNAIAISSDCSTVAVAWRNFTFVSFDQGGSWTHLGVQPDQTGDEVASLHSDYHAVTFDPTDPTTLYLGNDGGVFSASGVVQNADLVNSPTFVSNYNRYLFDLQFYHAAAIPDPQEASLVVAGVLQDNGDLGTVVPGAWQAAGTGDGYNLGFVNPPALPFGNQILLLGDDRLLGNDHHGAWRSVETNPFGVPTQPQPEIPISGSSTSPVPTWGTPLAVVRFPHFSLLAGPNAGEKMYAVAAYQGLVYGLFAHDDGTGLNWVTLGCVGGGQNVTALSSYDGFSIFLGMDDGNIYRMDSPYACGEPVKLLAINPPPNVINGPQGGCQNCTITAILEVLPGVAFAALQVGGNGYVLEWQEQAQTWEVVGGGLPNEVPFTALEAPSLLSLFAATGRRVYVTHDLGNSWMLASDGLPMVPQGLDLHFVVGPDGTKYLYLATYGRSLWRAVLP